QLLCVPVSISVVRYSDPVALRDPYRRRGWRCELSSVRQCGPRGCSQLRVRFVLQHVNQQFLVLGFQPSHLGDADRRNMTIPDKYAFWRWPARIRQLSKQLEELKTEHERVLVGQSKLLEWVKITHRLNSPAEGIRALIQQGKRIIPLLFLLITQSLWAQPAPPIVRSPLTTNSHFGPPPTEGQVPIWNAV